MDIRHSVFGILFALWASACATTPALHHSTTPIPVPFIAQHPNQCGPAALAMVANFYGHRVSQDEIAQAVYRPDIHGTLTVALAEYAKRCGFWVRQYQGAAGDLAAKLAAGVPVIVLGKIGESFHYFVVLQTGDPLVVHTDTRAFHKMSRDEFQRWWDRAGRWCLVVCPPEQATWKLSAAEQNDLGLFYEKDRSDYCMAEAHYRQAIALQPANSYYQSNLGNALLGQGYFPDAAAVFQHALALDPANADACNNLAWTYHELGSHLDDAVRLCRRAVELNPAKKAYYLDTLGSVLLQQGQRPAAKAAFAAALAAAPTGEPALRDAIQQRLREAETPVSSPP